MRRIIPALCFALLSTTACTEKVFVTAPQPVEEEKLQYQSVGIGQQFTAFLVLPVTDPNEQTPTVSYDSPKGLVGDRGKYVTSQSFGTDSRYVVQIDFYAKAAGTDTLTIKVSNQPNKVWTMMVIVGHKG